MQRLELEAAGLQASAAAANERAELATAGSAKQLQEAQTAARLQQSEVRQTQPSSCASSWLHCHQVLSLCRRLPCTAAYAFRCLVGGRASCGCFAVLVTHDANVYVGCPCFFCNAAHC